MAQEEKYNTRDRSYSAWHRRGSTSRFVGLEHAQLLAMIDMDAVPYTEYDDLTKEPLALIETAIDVGQENKIATVTQKLARRANLPGLVVLYKLANQLNPADPTFFDICQFRVKRLFPSSEKEWRVMSPKEYAELLLRMRDYKSKQLGDFITEDW